MTILYVDSTLKTRLTENKQRLQRRKNMKARNRKENGNKEYGDIKDIQAITSLGRSTCMKLGKDAGAVVRVGRRTLYNIEKILAYMEQIREE